MQFTEARSWTERGAQIQQLKDACNAARSSLDLPDSDARVQGFVQVRQTCNTLAGVAIKLQQSAEIPGNIPALLALLGLPDQPSLKRLLTDFNANAKASFLTMVQFQLENSARQVLAATTAEPVPNGFRQIAEGLVRVSNFPDPDQKLEQLWLPAYIRNTLHNNGIHTHSDKTLTVGGQAFVFTQGKRVDCGSWSHLFFAVYHSLAVYQEVYLSPPVTAIPSIPAA